MLVRLLWPSQVGRAGTHRAAAIAPGVRRGRKTRGGWAACGLRFGWRPSAPGASIIIGLSRVAKETRTPAGLVSSKTGPKTGRSAAFHDLLFDFRKWTK